MNVADDALRYQGRKFRCKITKFLPNPQLFTAFIFEFYSTISRQGNNQASLPLLFWLIEMVPYSSFLTAFAWVARMFLTGNAIVMTAIECVF